MGFSMSLGSCQVLQAELWGIIHSLKLARTKGFSKVLIESDSEIAIGLLNKGCVVTHPPFGERVPLLGWAIS